MKAFEEMLRRSAHLFFRFAENGGMSYKGKTMVARQTDDDLTEDVPALAIFHGLKDGETD